MTFQLLFFKRKGVGAAVGLSYDMQASGEVATVGKNVFLLAFGEDLPTHREGGCLIRPTFICKVVSCDA